VDHLLATQQLPVSPSNTNLSTEGSAATSREGSYYFDAVEGSNFFGYRSMRTRNKSMNDIVVTGSIGKISVMLACPERSTLELGKKITLFPQYQVDVFEARLYLLSGYEHKHKAFAFVDCENLSLGETTSNASSEPFVFRGLQFDTKVKYNRPVMSMAISLEPDGKREKVTVCTTLDALSLRMTGHEQYMVDLLALLANPDDAIQAQVARTIKLYVNMRDTQVLFYPPELSGAVVMSVQGIKVISHIQTDVAHYPLRTIVQNAGVFLTDDRSKLRMSLQRKRDKAYSEPIKAQLKALGMAEMVDLDFMELLVDIVELDGVVKTHVRLSNQLLKVMVCNDSKDTLEWMARVLSEQPSATQPTKVVRTPTANQINVKDLHGKQLG
jgi:hypothetical protein